MLGRMMLHVYGCVMCALLCVCVCVCVCNVCMKNIPNIHVFQLYTVNLVIVHV